MIRWNNSTQSHDSSPQTAILPETITQKTIVQTTCKFLHHNRSRFVGCGNSGYLTVGMGKHSFVVCFGAHDGGKEIVWMITITIAINTSL